MPRYGAFHPYYLLIALSLGFLLAACVRTEDTRTNPPNATLPTPGPSETENAPTQNQGDAFATTPPYTPVAAEGGNSGAELIARGEEVYSTTCQACHQANGLGLAGTFPPLIGSEWVVGEAEIPILIVLKGLQGPIEVAGDSYQNVMPPWEATLSDEDVAAVVSFVRQWESNDASAIAVEEVTELRSDYEDRTTAWTIEELQAEVEAP